MLRTIVSMCSVGLLANAARAQVVHFTNPAFGQPGHYLWHWEVGGPETWLDVTRSPSQQANAFNGNSIGQLNRPFGFPWANYTEGGASVAYQGDLTQPLAFGDPLSGRAYTTGAFHYDWDAEPQSLFVEGVRCYIGVLTHAGNYGWVEVSMSGGGLVAHSWAYEATPGVSLAAGQVPAPGVAGVLLIGVAAIRRRRAL